MELIKTIRLDETTSTNLYLRNYAGDEGRLMTVVTAEHQTAGRGQGRNTWESEAGKNLLFSIKTRPERLAARRQFAMLEAGALAVRDALAAYADGITVKWPNDVYWHDLKISGTLSECTVSGGLVGTCVLGTGININQQTFTGGAPNPVSLCHVTGHDVCRDEVLDAVITRFAHYLGMVNAGAYDDIDALYAAALYRRTGLHAYRDASGEFMAEVERVEPDGRLVLRKADGEVKEYLFKEVEHVITNPNLTKTHPNLPKGRELD